MSNKKLEMAQYKFIGRISKLCDSFGLNKFVAQLYAVLYLSDKPLSLDDLVEKLGVSKGNISINIRELEKWGAVKSVWVKGSRRDYYEAELDIKKIVLDKVKLGVSKRIKEVTGMLEEFNEIVNSADNDMTEDEKKTAELYRERLKKVEELNDLASNALAIADKFLR